jgi:hypothetical protein
VLAILYAVTVFSLVGNVTRLRDGMQIYRTFGTTMRAQLSAIEIAAPAERPSFTTRLGFPPLGIGVAGPYLQAVKRNGSPAYSSRELARQSEGQRAVADGVLVSALRLHLSTPNPGQSASSCRRFGLGLGGPAAVVLGPPGAELRSSTTAQVAVSRYGSSDTIPVGTLRPGSAADLRIPRDRAALPWRVMIGTTPARITVCKL